MNEKERRESAFRQKEIIDYWIERILILGEWYEERVPDNRLHGKEVFDYFFYKYLEQPEFKNSYICDVQAKPSFWMGLMYFAGDVYEKDMDENGIKVDGFKFTKKIIRMTDFYGSSKEVRRLLHQEELEKGIELL